MNTRNLHFKKVMLVLLLVVSFNKIFSDNNFIIENKLLKNSNQNFFIENKGQWHPDVLFLYKTGGMDAWITKYGINYNFYKKIESNFNNNKDFINDNGNGSGGNLIGHRVIMEYLNHNFNVVGKGNDELEGKYNYYIGNDVAKHVTGVNLYKEVTVKNIYDGIDIRYYVDRGYLRYDYIIQPGADASKIEFQFKGQSNDYIKQNNLIFVTRFGNIEISELQSFQASKKIGSKFIKNGSNYSFQLGAYDKDKQLVIDPLIYSTFLGGSSEEIINDIAYNANDGRVYLTGKTNSSNYDLSTGPYQNALAGLFDVFVTKFNTGILGNALVYSTYLGGTNEDEASSIVVNSSGNAYITGTTLSSNFPTSTSCYQASRNGTVDAFITSLTSSGLLNTSTYLGGGSEEYGTGIALDNNNNIYVTGYTNSVNFPLNNHYQTYQGNYDVYVTKFQSNGNTLVYSTFIGGSQNDKSYDIVVDGTNAAYVVGATESTSFPLSMDATQSTYGGGAYDGFITKLNSNGNNILFSTYLGGNDDDQINAIDLSKTNIFYNIHVTGRTASSNFPVTTSAYQTGFAGIFDAFVSKISYNGNLAFSTFIGGNGNDNSRDIKVINNMNYITGNTSGSFPTTTGSIDLIFNGIIDAFVTKLNSTGDQLIYSTYIGGSQIDYGLAIDVDTINEYIYTAGQTYSSDFPLSFLTYQNTLDGSNDAFLAKICPISAYLTSTTGTDSQSVCVNNAIANITYMTSGVTNVTFTGLPGGVNGSFANDVITIAGTPNTAGTYNYSVNISSACGNITQTGTIVVNSCTSIEEFNHKIEFNVFPNPSNGNFQIVTNKPITIEIVDITGKVLNKYYINEKQKSIQENFSEGIYFIRDVDNNYFKKIIITK